MTGVQSQNIKHNHQNYEPHRRNGYGQRKEKKLAFRIDHGKGDQHAHGGTAGTDDHRPGGFARQVGDQCRQHSQSTASDIKKDKLARAQQPFHIGTEDKEPQHIQEKMQQAAMQKLVGERRPNQTTQKGGRLKGEPLINAQPGIGKPLFHRVRHQLHYETGNIHQDQHLHRPGDSGGMEKGASLLK